MNPDIVSTPFPIPVVNALGPGSQSAEAPDFVPMPHGMDTYAPPPLPEPEVLAGHPDCVGVLRAALEALRGVLIDGPTAVIALDALGEGDRALLNQVLGEGDVAAQVLGRDAVRVQESVFTGVWRVVHLRDGAATRDTLEVGAIPQCLVDTAGDDDAAEERAADAEDETLMNAPAILAELRDRQRRWRPGLPPHVVNLTLLPLSSGDAEHLNEQLGSGRVVVLSRGYGNCRIASTRLPRIWRVTYFNSTDLVILDTLEVSLVPEVACAAAEDLEDSAERLAEVLDWVQQG